MVSSSGRQHVEMFRKLMLRKGLLKRSLDGPVYVPFIGDGDIAFALYAGRTVYGADLDKKRIAVAEPRFPGNAGLIIVADCNAWPFPGLTDDIMVADFDAYSDPYESFRSFWVSASHPKRMVLFFTDGARQGLMRSGRFHRPDGAREFLEDVRARRKIFAFYWTKTIKPWFKAMVAPYRVLQTRFYLRGWMLYWGAVLER